MVEVGYATKGDSMELVKEMTLHADLDEGLAAGPGPLGTRMIISVTGGWVKGDRINGTVVGAGADWLLIGEDGFGRLDVRAQVRTDDDAIIYVQYPGLLEMNEAVMTALDAGSTGFDDQYFRTTPRLETGDPRYAWVNTAVFVARGRVAESGVEYEVFRIT
jgi:hypothetical protein